MTIWVTFEADCQPLTARIPGHVVNSSTDANNKIEYRFVIYRLVNVGESDLLNLYRLMMDSC